MNKYRSFDDYQTSALEIESYLMAGEHVLWKGKPSKRAFVVNKICNMLPLALVWFGFDAFFILAFLIGETEIAWFLILFFAVHLTPVWVWLSGVITAGKHWSNTEYMLTDRRMVLKNGFLAQNVTTFTYAQIRTVNLRIGALDSMLKVGDIHVLGYEGERMSIVDIKRPEVLANQLQQIVMDMQNPVAQE